MALSIRDTALYKNYFCLLKTAGIFSIIVCCIVFSQESTMLEIISVIRYSK